MRTFSEPGAGSKQGAGRLLRRFARALQGGGSRFRRPACNVTQGGGQRRQIFGIKKDRFASLCQEKLDGGFIGGKN